jgi:glutathione S-transferase
MTTLYFHPLSTPSLYPLFVANAAGVTHTRKVVNLQTQEQQSDEYLAINPFGRVPALVDEDFAIGESGAIGRYLARKSGSDIYSEDFRDAARIDQWVEFIVHHIRVNVGRVQYNRFIAPMINEPVDTASMALGEKFLAANLPHIERALSGESYLHGDRLTLADIALIAALEPRHTAKLELTDFPVLTAWLDATRKLDWYQSVHTHFGAEMGL